MHSHLVMLAEIDNRYAISPKPDIFSLDWQCLAENRHCRLAKSHPYAIGWQNLSTDQEKLSRGHRSVESSIPFHNRLKACKRSLSCVGSPRAYNGHLFHDNCRVWRIMLITWKYIGFRQNQVHTVNFCQSARKLQCILIICRVWRIMLIQQKNIGFRQNQV